jgi:hypothetical protein
VIEDGVDKFLAERYHLDPEKGFVGTLIALGQTVTKPPLLILFLDALNEFSNPSKLLDSLYSRLIVPTEHLPWFKIVLSCRTESWARMEGSFQGERRFLQTEGNAIHRLARFDPAELEAAYQKYRNRYKIQTEFSELSPQVKRFIALPLMLRLVTEGCTGKSVPPILKSHEVLDGISNKRWGNRNNSFRYKNIKL